MITFGSKHAALCVLEGLTASALWSFRWSITFEPISLSHVLVEHSSAYSTEMSTLNLLALLWCSKLSIKSSSQISEISRTRDVSLGICIHGSFSLSTILLRSFPELQASRSAWYTCPSSPAAEFSGQGLPRIQSGIKTMKETALYSV